MGKPLLAVRNLTVQFRTYAGTVHALNGLNLEICKGQALGLVGETGCGKSMAALSIMGLLPPGGEIVSGEIYLQGEQLLGRSESYLQRIRGARIAMIFQDPDATLNPLFTVGEQVRMVIRRHQHLSDKGLYQRVCELLQMVELPDPAQAYRRYPHELSGGMKQRVSIAIALSCGAELLIADEPTTALDVTVQAQILNLLDRLRVSHHLALLLITHDLAVVAETCQRVAVLYAGRIVEEGSVEQVMLDPKHPYTQALLRALPRPDSRGIPLQTIGGSVPSGLVAPEGCMFRPRCPYALPICSDCPPMMEVGPDWWAACFRSRELDE